MQYCMTYTFFLTTYDVGGRRMDLMADVATSPFFEAESIKQAAQIAKSYDAAGNAVVLNYHPKTNRLWAGIDNAHSLNPRLQGVISVRPFSYNMESCLEQDLTESECLKILTKHCHAPKAGSICRFAAPISYGVNCAETAREFVIQQRGGFVDL